MDKDILVSEVENDGLELAMQELETMDAPSWSVVASALISLAGGISISVAIT
ncbi:daptide-type RiPP [Actinacidiphila sp. ITFR-21]|uniref:daptide-type RiPP n=1 Tax=Actinacidiphila sp. ITFR-21 TaxID=3075199 RepID=UPI0028892AD5|nr:daptide-type RiPP [Streptomyces sp. ITFR-21]WNI16178.1 daptide-type RiPP [Streptomyces sp. ITFR-21]